MAVRTVHTSAIFRSASPSALCLPASRCRRSQPFLHPVPSRKHSCIQICFSRFGPEQRLLGFNTSTQTHSLHSLVDCIIGEFNALRKAKKIRAAAKMGLARSEVLLEEKLEKQQLRKGLLLEFKKDSERVLLAVAQKPDGKKNWMVYDQNGVSTSVKPQQITYIDPTLLEFAWNELLDKNKSVAAEELAEMIFGSVEPLESYCSHLLLSNDEIYFSVLERKGSHIIYLPRPSAQVEELIRRKHSREAAEKEFQEFIDIIKSAKAMPVHSKPPKSSWIEEENTWKRIESLEAFAIDSCITDEQKRIAGEILNAMGLTKMANSAVNLLIDIGYFPVHVNIDLLKCNIRTDHSEVIISGAETLLAESNDIDEVDDRKDLTHLKVYAIDVDEADELDDALSATRLQDGRIKVWIHIADPTALVQPGSLIDMEARRRGTSVFLPTATYPMFPEKLAMEGMSLQQGKLCKTVTVSVVLNPDGSIAEYSVDNTLINATYLLTYESASELLHLNLEEEAELRILSEAATLRSHWRRQQGAIDTSTIEARIKVVNPEDPEPQINLYVEDQANPAMRLVFEMMILCGEAIATFGSCNNLPLPYRGVARSYTDLSAFSHLPEGPIKTAAIVKSLGPAVLDFRQPKRHGVLGIPGYVQFSSPIRRYIDLLAHYQVKAFLRGDDLPFSVGNLEGLSSVLMMQTKAARQLSSTSLRYWTIEYLRRQPREKRYRALVLRFIKDRFASLLLSEVAFHGAALVSVGVQVGDEVQVFVVAAHPRNDSLSLKEIIT
ncbi:hypothetical protein V2J09_004257 [Rumex salicifolius]